MTLEEQNALNQVAQDGQGMAAFVLSVFFLFAIAGIVLTVVAVIRRR